MAPIAASGCSTPISLLAAMMEMSTVRGVIAARSSAEIDEALRVHAEPGDAAALALEALAGVEHRLVLGRGGDDVIAAIAQRVGDALDREVVGLGRAAREDDLVRPTRRRAPATWPRAASTAFCASQP